MRVIFEDDRYRIIQRGKAILRLEFEGDRIIRHVYSEVELARKAIKNKKKKSEPWTMSKALYLLCVLGKYDVSDVTAVIANTLHIAQNIQEGHT